jgi:hypothetical protein
VLLFLLYNGAFVRQDAIHVIRSWTTVLLVVDTETVAAICCWSLCAIPRWRAKSAVGLAIASLALCSAPLSDWYARDILARDLLAQPAAAAKFARTPLKMRQWYFEQQWGRVRHHAPLQDIDGSVATIGWNEPIDIPSEHRDSLLVAEVRFRRNVGGRLAGLFHHPPPVQMVLEKSDGSEASVRLNSLLSEQGVVAAAEVPDPDYGAHLRRRRYTGDDAPQTIIEGHWGGSGAALHLARHPVLTEVQSNVRRIRFRARTLGWDASALFAPELHVRIRVVSLGEPSQPQLHTGERTR